MKQTTKKSPSSKENFCAYRSWHTPASASWEESSFMSNLTICSDIHLVLQKFWATQNSIILLDCIYKVFSSFNICFYSHYLRKLKPTKMWVFWVCFLNVIKSMVSERQLYLKFFRRYIPMQEMHHDHFLLIKVRCITSGERLYFLLNTKSCLFFPPKQSEGHTPRQCFLQYSRLHSELHKPKNKFELQTKIKSPNKKPHSQHHFIFSFIICFPNNKKSYFHTLEQLLAWISEQELLVSHFTLALHSSLL